MKKALTIFITFFPLLAFAQNIKRIEPPFWWIDMSNPKLQLMFYGDSIGFLRPEIVHDDIVLERSVSTTNPNYLFIYLDIQPNKQPGTFTIRFRNANQEIKSSIDYKLCKREHRSAQRKGYDNSDTMVLITPDRFANGNTDNDNVDGMLEKANRKNKWGRHGGDIQGISEHLDYLESMGFTAIWLNPVLENNQKQYSYHGYSTTDFYKVDPRLGTNEEYVNLSQKARDKGIKLVKDMILNHCGSGHWWMDDLPSSDWINNPENYFQTNHQRSSIRDPYASDYDRQHFSDGWFVPTMPDLNQKNPLLADYLIQNTIWWIEYAGLAGIRIDTFSYSDKEFLRDWTCAVKNEYPDFNMCGEEWSLNPAVLAYWQKGKENPDGYTSCLPGLLDFPIQHALVNGLKGEEQWNSGLINLYEMLSNDFMYADPYKHVIFPDNHDMSRIYTQLNEDYGLFKLAMVYFATMRGTPQFYYGTEILLSNKGDNSHGNIRCDFPGGWPDDHVNAFTGKNLTEQQKEAQRFVRKLLTWRKSATVIHNGKLKHFVPQNGTYVYFRYDDGKKVMVILNKSKKKQDIDLGQFAEILTAGSAGWDILSEETITFAQSLTIHSKQPMIIEIE